MTPAQALYDFVVVGRVNESLLHHYPKRLVLQQWKQLASPLLIWYFCLEHVPFEPSYPQREVSFLREPCRWPQTHSDRARSDLAPCGMTLHVLTTQGRDPTSDTICSGLTRFIYIAARLQRLTRILTTDTYMLRPNLKHLTRFKTGRPNLKWVNPFPSRSTGFKTG